MSSAIRVRAATSADAEALARLSAQLGYPADAVMIAERMRLIAERYGEIVLLAASEDESVLGFAHASFRSSLISEPYVGLAAMVVDENVRGRGIGAALLRAVEQWSRERGVAEVRVLSRVTRERAHRFYLREGYAEHKRQAIFFKQLG